MQTRSPAAGPHIHSPAPRRRRPFGAAGVAILLSALAPSALAGVSLSSRQTALQAKTGAIDNEADPGLMSDSAVSFDGFASFAQTIGGDRSAGTSAEAQQYSSASVGDETGAAFSGAFGEGSVRANAPVAGALATSSSAIELLFRVDDRPARYALGGVLGAEFGGSAEMRLSPVVADVVGEPLFVQSIAPDTGESSSLMQESDLTPGDYLLQIQADAGDAGTHEGESSAYYSFSFSVSSLGEVRSAPAAVPMPTTGLVGGAGLASLLVGFAIRRLRLSGQLR